MNKQIVRHNKIITLSVTVFTLIISCIECYAQQEKAYQPNYIIQFEQDSVSLNNNATDKISNISDTINKYLYIDQTSSFKVILISRYTMDEKSNNKYIGVERALNVQDKLEAELKNFGDKEFFIQDYGISDKYFLLGVGIIIVPN